jgi:hypothetical protein
MYHNVLFPLRLKAKLKGMIIGLLVVFGIISFNYLQPSNRSFKVILAQSLSDPYVVGFYLFFSAVGLVLGFILAESQKERKLWQEYVAVKMREWK